MKNIHFSFFILVILLTSSFFFTLQAQEYELFFLQNEDFDNNLGGYFIGIEQPVSGQTVSAGTLEWSSEYGGSAHMSVDGSPSTVDLISWIGTTIYPGDIIECRVTNTNLDNFGNVDLQIGGAWTSFSQTEKLPSTSAGTQEIQLIANRIYTPGTGIRIHLVTFPGSGEAWIHYIHLIKSDHTVSVFENPSGKKIPNSFELNNPFPNPTNGGTRIEFDIKEKTDIEISIYNILGQKIKSINKGTLSPGNYFLTWDGTDTNGNSVATGTYYFDINNGTERKTKKSLILR